MALNFNKYAQEANTFINKLSTELGHPDQEGKVGILLRSVLHVIRDSITISESLNFISQLPLFLKAIYVDQWKFHEKPPIKYNSIDGFSGEVEKLQFQFGEREFDWNQSTAELIGTVIHSLGEYISPGEFEDIAAQMPKEVKELFLEKVKS